jgi:DNA-binding response OmpR family regulator
MNANCSTSSPKLVLIVDDIEDNRILLERALRSSGYATVQASSGREALSIISRQLPDIVLLDWMMPEISGLDTLRAIRELHPKTRLPVIMCTALSEEMSVVTALNEGANDYMLKPISLPILRARMSTHLDQLAAIDTLATEKQQAERRLSEQTRAMFSAMSREREDGAAQAKGSGD